MICTYFTYVLKSLSDNNLYIGYTESLWKRMEEHKKGHVKSIKHRRPLMLVYYEACYNQQKALMREKYLKTTYGHRYLKNRIAESNGLLL